MSDTSTQPTVPAPNVYGQTTVPPTNPSATPPPVTMPPTPAAGGRISPSLKDPNVFTEEGGEYSLYAIGVRGRKVFDANGKLIRYEGFKRFTPKPDNRLFGITLPSTMNQPQYFQGDEDKIFQMSVEDLSNLQRSMNAVGLLGDNYAPGVADNATRAAYYNLMEQANGYLEDTDATILRLAAAGGGQGTGRGLTQYRVSNEADVKAVMSRAAKQTLGRNLGEGDLNMLANMYRELEKQAGLAAGSATQQEVVTAPSPEVFAQNQLEQMFPTETKARQFGSYLKAIKEKYQI